jgi:hypothetical protein
MRANGEDAPVEKKLAGTASRNRCALKSAARVPSLKLRCEA